MRGFNPSTTVVLLSLCALAAGACRGGETLESAAHSETASSGQAGCPEQVASPAVRVQHLRSEEDREVFAVDPEPELGGEASRMWEGDLNGDGHADLVLRFFELCGNYGDCPFAVYAGCGEDRFVPVWGPRYAVALEIPKSSPSAGWAELVQVELHEDASGGDFDVMTTLSFQSGRYEPIVGSERRSR